MQLRFRLTLLTFLILAAPMMARAETPPPTTQPAAIDPHSARGALKAISDQLPAGGMKAALAAYHTSEEKQRGLAKSLARADLGASKLEKLTREKFGTKAADDIVHAMRLPTDTDLANATEKVDGDKATIDFPDGRDSLTMVKVNGKWKISVADLLDAGEKEEDFTKTNNELTEAIDEVTKKLESGDIANAFLLERAVKQRLYRILGEDDEN
jgi:hypothetical protein